MIGGQNLVKPFRGPNILNIAFKFEICLALYVQYVWLCTVLLFTCCEALRDFWYIEAPALWFQNLKFWENHLFGIIPPLPGEFDNRPTLPKQYLLCLFYSQYILLTFDAGADLTHSHTSHKTQLLVPTINTTINTTIKIF